MKENMDQNNNREDTREGNADSKEVSSNASNETTSVYLTPNSTLQSPEEDKHDKGLDPRTDSSLSVSNDDLRKTDVDRYAGSDRPGTSERKDNSLD